MKITKLEVENFKKLRAVCIKPDGSVVMLGGRNGAGKSSVLDSIQSALGGGKRAPEEPVRKGTKRATVVLETEKFIVTRRFSAKGPSTLEIKGRDGSVYPSPQALLDSIVGPLSFDVLTFVRQPGKAPADAARAQAAALRQIVALDFTKQEYERKVAFDERTDVTRELKRVQAQLDKLPDVDAGDEAEVSVAELAGEIRKRQAVNTAKADKGRDLERLREKARATSDIIEDLELKLKASREMLVEIQTRGKAMKAELDAMPDADVAEVEAKLADAEGINRRVRLRTERAKLETELNQLIEKCEGLTGTIEGVDAAKRSALEAAKYPVDGLAVTDEGITLDGVPFSQASQAQQLKVSVAIGLALNPELKVLLIRDGSLLDEDSLAAVAKMAADHDAQVWLEVVGNREDATVIIEDGEVQPAELCGGIVEEGLLQPAGLSD